MKLKRAWALDLTTEDENGNPWDFSIASQRKKVMELLERDKPLLLVVCPMCGPFSSINDFNYTKMNDEEVRDKLQDAMMHMRFALTMCLQQFLAGRLFMFEHPAGASLWETTMMHAMLGRAGEGCTFQRSTSASQGWRSPAQMEPSPKQRRGRRS